MKCLQIRICNFRNIEQAQIDFSDGINLFLGNNAQGKTNLLEALFFGTIGKSFRDSRDKNLIRFGQDFFTLLLSYKEDREDARTQTIEIRVSEQEKKQIFHNKVFVKKLSDVVGDFRAVLFCPEHLAMVKDGPQERRTFLDMALSQLFPVYLESLQKYNRLVKEKNALLREQKKETMPEDARDVLGVLNEQMARECAILTWYRAWYVRNLDRLVRTVFSEMTEGAECPQVQYAPGLNEEQKNRVDEILPQGLFGIDAGERKDCLNQIWKLYLTLLRLSTDRECIVGTALYGPHKDDMILKINEKEARLYASQGQQRSFALALKIAEGEISRSYTGEYPLFLFDDVLSELDEKRKQYLLQKIREKQVIMTSCEKLDMEKNARIWDVSQGMYKERT
ncbi:MAG: DNA replication/repair protein RecF [Clostridia bacterium]|nr:DNA replication/repair protein RecF [Clostridia bacterium]